MVITMTSSSPAVWANWLSSRQVKFELTVTHPDGQVEVNTQLTMLTFTQSLQWSVRCCHMSEQNQILHFPCQTITKKTFRLRVTDRPPLPPKTLPRPYPEMHLGKGIAWAGWGRSCLVLPREGAVQLHDGIGSKCIMIYRPPPPPFRVTDMRHNWKHYVPVTFGCGRWKQQSIQI